MVVDRNKIGQIWLDVPAHFKETANNCGRIHLSVDMNRLLAPKGDGADIPNQAIDSNYSGRRRVGTDELEFRVEFDRDCAAGSYGSFIIVDYISAKWKPRPRSSCKIAGNGNIGDVCCEMNAKIAVIARIAYHVLRWIDVFYIG